MRIGDAAAAAGISTNQLQYYVYMHVVLPSHRSATGQRLFDRYDIQRIRMVRLLNESGYPLREIREIFMEHRDGRPVSR
jgi:DNA-binding transcriptional MerR regulator